MIRKEGDKYVIYNHDQTKKLGEYDSKKAAEERLKQIEMFSHIEDVSNEKHEFKHLKKAVKDRK